MWAYKSVFYQIYPLGFCGAPLSNDFVSQPVTRIVRVAGWIDQIAATGANAVYFGPVFESSAHGYDTADYRIIDRRLGTNAHFASVCKALNERGIRVVLDGVFNHVGRDFWAFKDVRERKWDSPYKDWFIIDFNGNSNYNDGFWYKGWEGHYELVALNLQNPQVKEHIFSCIAGWVEEFEIDGLRLDVAYSLDPLFLSELRAYCSALKPGFFLLGETLHGDYNRWCSDTACHSVTNYECYKGLYSSFNSMNMFEIAHSLARQYGPENWPLYKGKHLFNFLDNHDVTRIASILTEKAHIYPAYTLLFSMPGIPCVYYGSEWGATGEKGQGDSALRPEFKAPEARALTEHIKKLAEFKKGSDALNYGGITQLELTNKQFAFMRQFEGERAIALINAENAPHVFNLCKAGSGKGTDILTGAEVDVSEPLELPAFGSMLIAMD